MKRRDARLSCRGPRSRRLRGAVGRGIHEKIENGRLSCANYAHDHSTEVAVVHLKYSQMVGEQGRTGRGEDTILPAQREIRDPFFEVCREESVACAPRSPRRLAVSFVNMVSPCT